MAERPSHPSQIHLTCPQEDRWSTLLAPKLHDLWQTSVAHSGIQPSPTSKSTKPLPAWQYPPSSPHSVVSRVSTPSQSRPTNRPTGDHPSLSGSATGMLSRFSKIIPIVSKRVFAPITAFLVVIFCHERMALMTLLFGCGMWFENAEVNSLTSPTGLQKHSDLATQLTALSVLLVARHSFEQWSQPPT